MRTIEFYFDVACPYAHLAATQIDRIAATLEATVVWNPVLLQGLLESRGIVDETGSTASESVSKVDLQRWAQFWGVPLRVDAPPRASEAVMRWLWTRSAKLRPAAARWVMASAWEQGHDLQDPVWRAKAVSRYGGAIGETDDEPGRAGLAHATAEAAFRGVLGVPTFVVDGRLWWGHDRLGVMARSLGVDLDPAAWAKPATVARVSPRTVEFFHDFASPFSYLAATQVERIAARRGAQVRWSPILLGGLFREIGTADVPLFAMDAAKQAWTREDLHRWASAWGTAFVFPEHFPLRSVLPLRAALVEPRATSAIYRAVWEEGRVVDSTDGLAQVLEGAGFDASAILARTADPEIKGQLRENTERAATEGICGVPSYVVRGADLPATVLWGQDRLIHLDALLAGWSPAPSRTP